MRHIVRRLLPEVMVDALKRWRSNVQVRRARNQVPTDYWTAHHVDAPDSGFSTVAESLAHYEWRNHVNPGQLELMPVDDVTGKVVLDYGCGPGNDVIGLGTFSRPARLLACDVSSRALQIAGRRAALHGLAVEFTQISDTDVSLPYETGSIDVIHTAGVLHHTTDPLSILKEFHRVLRPNGEVRVMVYHRDSLWMHLYVSYVLMIQKGLYRGMAPDAAFERSTDGDACPIARCYRADDFLSLARDAGLTGEFLGAGMTLTELELLPQRWSALGDKRLSGESRDFLYGLTFNDRGWPLHQGHAAGVNAYFRLQPA